MAPEQARGRPVDRRADIWAFGVVLYEMLSGRRAFEGDDISITLASVLKDSVDFKTLPDDVPGPIKRLLRRCLEKDPRRRLSAMGDARLELEEAADAPEQPRATLAASAHTRSAPVLAWVLAAVGLAAGVVMLVMWAPWQAAPPPERMVFELETPGALGANTPVSFALSPDGRHLVTRSQMLEGYSDEQPAHAAKARSSVVRRAPRDRRDRDKPVLVT
jgi:serine/threonine-protein kinase